MVELLTRKRVMGAASMIGDQLISAEGEELGVVQELLIDSEAGLVTYAVVSFLCIPGFDETLFVVPWKLLQACPEQHKFVLAVDRANLVRALASHTESEFDAGDWQWATNGQESFGFKRTEN